MIVLSTTLAALLFIGSLLAHEAGHALILQRLGFTIKEAGLGLPFKPRLILPPTERRPFALSLSPWLFGAYVMGRDEDEEQINALPYKDNAWFSGIGVVVNLVLGLLLGAVGAALSNSPLRAAIYVTIAAALWYGQILFTAYVIPALALPGLVFMAFSIATTLGQPSGVVAIGHALVVANPITAIEIAGVLSFSVGILNMLPLWPFDGGRICGQLIRQWFGKKAELAFSVVGILTVLASFCYSEATDIFWVLFG